MRPCVGALAPGGSADARAIGSAGERLVHTEEVTGSIPLAPTGTPQVRPLGRPCVTIYSKTSHQAPQRKPRPRMTGVFLSAGLAGVSGARKAARPRSGGGHHRPT